MVRRLIDQAGIRVPHEALKHGRGRQFGALGYHRPPLSSTYSQIGSAEFREFGWRAYRANPYRIVFGQEAHVWFFTRNISLLTVGARPREFS